MFTSFNKECAEHSFSFYEWNSLTQQNVFIFASIPECVTYFNSPIAFDKLAFEINPGINLREVQSVKMIK